MLSKHLAWLAVATAVACGSTEPHGPDGVGGEEVDIPEPAEGGSSPGEPAATPPCESCVLTIGGNDEPGFQDGPDALFDAPLGVAVDSQGRVFVADELNHAVRMIVCDDTFVCSTTTVAGNGVAGYRDGPGSIAQLRNPVGIAVGPDDAIYVVEFKGHRVRRLTCTSTNCDVATLAGTGTAGFSDGAAHLAQFNSLDAVAVAADGRVLVVEELNNRLREIACDTQPCEVRTLAGTGAFGSDDGDASTATFDALTGVAASPDGSVFVVEWFGNRVRAIDGDDVSTFAGTGFEGYVDGPNAMAQFAHPRSIAADDSGKLYIADQGNNRIRTIDSGMVATLAGGGESGPPGGAFADGALSDARFHTPRGVAVDARGRVYVADTDNNRVRVIFP